MSKAVPQPAIDLEAWIGGRRVVVDAAVKRIDLHSPVDGSLNYRMPDAGADLVIERSPHDWASELSAVVPSGVDVVLDVVGGEYVRRNLKAMAFGGRHVSGVGRLAGHEQRAVRGSAQPRETAFRHRCRSTAEPEWLLPV